MRRDETMSQFEITIKTNLQNLHVINGNFV